ncbi:hypothetical protein LOTGIDRAFT_238344 [Lottia gigantea]|uniref:CUB domain-containing protein n=1 Tax=Lottia gigantea TaxID=225164 RepID=V4AAV9_LOTGI|nr:hypothetical protein LOTGIDRAFT_238344 [Lottia gigantea]ESP01139.1 hypothetical protein LOTGIDRAFT_238344 [Lottia gigantea]
MRNIKIVTCISLLISILSCGIVAQNNLNTPDNYEFYMDSSSDCNGPTRNVYDARATIKGQGALQTGSGPTSCTIALKTEKPYELAVFKIEIRALQIADCGVRFTIYDGDAGINHLAAFDCNFGKQPNMQPFTTSGDKVTFVLSREDIRNTQYDIEVVATPLVAGRDPGYSNGDGSDYGYNYHRKFPTEAIVGIVGGLFAIILIIAIIVGVHCYRKHKGMNRKWEQQPLSYINTPSNFDTASKISKTDLSETSSVWASEVSKTPAYKPAYARSKSRSRPDFDDDADSVSFKRSYRNGSLRTGGRRYRSQEFRPPGYNTATKNSRRNYDDDARSQDSMIDHEPPIKHKERENRPQSTSIGLDPIDTEDTEREEEQTESEVNDDQSESRREEDQVEAEDEGLSPKATRPKPAVLPKPVPHPRSHSVNPQTQEVPPEMIPDPRIQSAPQFMAPQQYYPYGQMPPQQQFIPVQAMPYGMQPVPVGYPQPVYPTQDKMQSEPALVPTMKPTDPPVYSYLVQRGYTPLDGRQSPASSQQSVGSHHSGARLLKDEPADSGQISSGVEFMRR